MKAPPATLGKAPLISPTVRAQVIHFINKPMPGNLPKKTSRALLDIEDDKVIPVIRDPQKANGESEAVFYFPGCGSERLFSQVGLATQAMLYHVGAHTVLPPGYLCCGYPQTAAGEEDKGQKITTDNRVLFHRVANTLNYLDIKTVIVSCGTCMDQLQKYEFETHLPRLPPARHPRVPDGEGRQARRRVRACKYMYHEPCHTPMKRAPGHQGGQRADGHARRPVRPLLRRIGHARGRAPGHLHPGALPQAGRDREGRGQRCARATRARR